MVQLIQKVIDAFRLPSLAHGDNFDTVDPNLVRYFRTEYGRDWKSELEHYIYCQANKQSKNLVD